jgi:hypothetical protein
MIMPLNNFLAYALHSCQLTFVEGKTSKARGRRGRSFTAGRFKIVVTGNIDKWIVSFFEKTLNTFD